MGAQRHLNLPLLPINKQRAGPFLCCYILFARLSSHRSPWIRGTLERLRRVKAQFDGGNCSH